MIRVYDALGREKLTSEAAIATPPAPFDPDDISGLWTRLEPVALAGYSDNDPVGTWEDESAANHDGTQGTADNKPICKTNILNGLSVVRFTYAAASDWLEFADASALTAATAFIVVRLAEDPPSAANGTGLWNFSSSSDNTHLPYTDGTIYDAFGSTVRKTVGDPTISLSSAFRVYEVYSAPGRWSCWLNGNDGSTATFGGGTTADALFTTATNTVGISATPTLGKGVGSYFLNGDIAAFLLYDSGLSDDNRGLVRGYLRDEFAL